MGPGRGYGGTRHPSARPGPGDPPAWEGDPRRQRSRRGPTALVAAVAVALVGWALGGLGDWQADVGPAENDDTIPVTEGDAEPATGEGSPFGDGDGEGAEGPEPGASPDDEPAPEDGSLVPALGSWRELPDAPVPGRSDALAVWTGREALFWGGRSGHPLTDGAAYDPAADSWRPIPDAPRAWHWRDAAVWTGEEMLVVSDQVPIAYDPLADEWRAVADAPAGRWVWESAGRSGDEVIVVSASPHDPAGAIAYAPESDRWVPLPDPPLDDWDGSSSAWLGDRLVLVGTTDGDRWERSSVTALDPATETWSEPDPAPAPGRWLPSLIADSQLGRVLAVSPEYPVPEAVHEWSPGGGWRELPDVPGTPLASPGVPVDTGHRLLWWREDIPSRSAVLRRDAEWAPVAEPPMSERFSGTPVWAGDELVVWGREPRAPGEGRGAALSLERQGSVADAPDDVDELRGSWRWTRRAGFARVAPSLDWTGEELLLWGGVDGRPVGDGASYDPAEDAWKTLPDAPVRRITHASAWTGSELLVWGGVDEQARRDGAAYNPLRRRWREIAEAPVEPHGPSVSAWTGEELVVVTGTRDDQQGAALDPESNAWRRLPDPPIAGHRQGAVWTGREVLVVTDAADGAVARYDPERDAWAAASEIPVALHPDGVDLAWTGRELVVWGRHPEEPAAMAWAYRPEEDDWRALATPWLDRGPLADASAWGDGLWLVAGTSGLDSTPRLAAYDARDDEWLAVPEPPDGAPVHGPIAWTGEEFVVWTMHGDMLAFRPES